MIIWLRHHRDALARALRRMLRTPLVTLVSILVIGITLALPAAGYLVLSYVNAIAGRLNAEPQLSIYLAVDAGQSDVRAVETALKNDSRVASAQFVSRDDALAQMKSVSGLESVMEGLDRNPLPHAFVVKAKDGSPDKLLAMQAAFRQLPKVDEVLLDTAWAKKLANFNVTAERIVYMLAAALGLALIAVTGNTIRLQILTQRDEIEVGRLFGATNRYIRRPFLYFGGLQGALSGLLAVGLAIAGLRWLDQNLADLVQTYAPGFAPELVPVAAGAAVVAGAAALGWIGAYLSVSLYLRELRPD